jgi:hypothetical protein
VKLVAILPIPMIEEWTVKAGTLFGMHLALADKILGDDSYRQAYVDAVRRGEYVIVDNGAAENGYSVSADDLLEAARAVGAQEIVAPDILEDSEGTLEATEEFLVHVGSRLLEVNVKIMVVPQGKTGYEWQLCAQTMYELLKSLGLTRRVIIGVPKHLDKKVAGGRATTLKAITHGWGAPFKFHLLGSGDLLCKDVMTAKVLKRIRSIDTGLPAALAQNGKRLLPGVGRNGCLCDFSEGCDPYLLGLNLLEVKVWNSRVWNCPVVLKSESANPACVWCPLIQKR